MVARSHFFDFFQVRDKSFLKVIIPEDSCRMKCDQKPTLKDTTAKSGYTLKIQQSPDCHISHQSDDSWVHQIDLRLQVVVTGFYLDSLGLSVERRAAFNYAGYEDLRPIDARKTQ